MTQEERINRINELYRLSKERQLTEEERNEQGLLRAEYLSEIRASVKGQLGQIRIVEKDGSSHPVVSVKERKEIYRKKCLEIRNSISDERRIDAGEFLTGEVLKIVKILKVNKVLLYASKDKEVPTDGVFEALKEKGIPCFYPVTKEDEIVFYEADDLMNLQTGTFKVRVPKEEKDRAFHFEPEDDSVLILVPGLSFDDAGNRIGYGKGYYDRFLAGFEAESFVKSAGICYMECKEKKVTKALSPEEKALTKGGIPVGKGDIRTDFVITV